jgi:predicted nucleotidyltransferase
MHLEKTEKIITLLGLDTGKDLQPGINALADAARERHGDSVRAVLFYGSCLRSGNVYEGLADLYVLVDDYKSAFNSRALAFFNRLLPPNVFYLEIPFEGHVLRAKYAVLTLADFRKGTEHWFHSYLWGRFAQKTGIIYASDEVVKNQVLEALACAVNKFVSQTLPQMDSTFSARDLWSRGLALSYRSELRTEEPERAAERLFDANPAYYRALTQLVLETLTYDLKANAGSETYCSPVELPGASRLLNLWGWRVRILQGKVLSVLRLLKGFFTFEGGIDYILWKIERHSGVRVEIGETLRRFPPVAIVVIFWRLYRQNAFR